jgi:hypothetical protein
MLSREENGLLTRIGPGTAMGETMRRYWIPALLVRKVVPSKGARPKTGQVSTACGTLAS